MTTENTQENVDVSMSARENIPEPEKSIVADEQAYYTAYQIFTKYDDIATIIDDHVVIDLDHDMAHELIYPQGADQFEFYIADITLTEIEKAAEMYYDDEINGIQFENIPDDVDTHDLSDFSTDTGHAYVTEITIQSLQSRQDILQKGTWKCQQGHKTEKYHGIKEYKELQKPMRCAEDKCKGSPYRLVESRSDFQEIQQSVLIDNDADSDISLIGGFTGSMIDQYDERDTLRAVVKPVTPRGDDPSRSQYLQILGAQKLNGSIEIDDDVAEKAQEIANEYDLKEIRDSIAPGIIHKTGHRQAKLAILCSLVRGQRRNEERPTIHTLLYGQPQVGKSKIMEYVHDLDIHVSYADIAKTSSAGLVGTVRREERLEGSENWIVESGLIPQTHKGSVLLDELDKGSERLYQALNTPLASERVSIQKAQNADLEASVSVIGSSNPDNELFENDPQTDLPLPASLQSRFDLIITLRDYLQPGDERDEREVNRKVNNLRTGKTEIEPALDKEEMSMYITYARQQKVDFMDEAVEYISDKIYELKRESRKSQIGIHIGERQAAVLKRISEAIAKLQLKDEVDIDDVDRAWELVKYQYQQLTDDEFTFDDDDLVKSIDISENKSDVYRKVRGVLIIRDDISIDVLSATIPSASDDDIRYVVEYICETSDSVTMTDDMIDSNEYRGD